MKSFFGALFLTFVMAISAQAATFQSIYQGKSLVMSGPILLGDDQRFVDAYNENIRRYGQAPERIFLNSPGGQVWAGFDLALIVRESGIDTVLGKTDKCFSACVFVFAAGQHRAIVWDRWGRIGMLGVHEVHQIGSEGECSSAGAGDTTTVGVRVLEAFGAPNSLIVKMVTTSCNDIYIPSVGELNGWVEWVESTQNRD